MNVMHDLAEARATALVLRATAKVVRAEQDSLMFRLNGAADTLDRSTIFLPQLRGPSLRRAVTVRKHRRAAATIINK